VRLRGRTSIVPPTTLSRRDVAGEAVNGVLQRPGRSVLTALGTILGVASFVAILGLTSTTSGQISKRFDSLVATAVSVEDTGGEHPELTRDAFPADADRRIESLNGVRRAGVFWQVKLPDGQTVTGVPMPGVRPDGDPISVMAASPGALGAMHASVGSGRLYDEFAERRAERVAILGATVARRLGIARLDAQPAVFIGGTPFTVIGIVDDVDREAEVLHAVVLPRGVVERIWGPPDVSDRAKMLIDTDLGAAQVIAGQAPLALRPDGPELFKVIPPPDPRALRDGVTTDLNGLFLILAAICLIVGAVGIANTTLVAVLERVPEIGLRRALGARPRHIAYQFLCESGTIGTLAGIVGTAVGLAMVVGVAALEEWTPILAPWTVLPAPLIGTLTGLLAGLYPALRAAGVEPVEALRR
jgi:putative ABC transport system permease protein